MKNTIFLIFSIIILVTAIYTAYYFYNNEKSAKESLDNTKEIILFEIGEDYERIITNVDTSFNLPTQDGPDLSIGKINKERKDLEKIRKQRLNEQYKMKDVPLDWYFNTSIPIK